MCSDRIWIRPFPWNPDPKPTFYKNQIRIRTLVLPSLQIIRNFLMHCRLFTLFCLHLFKNICYGHNYFFGLLNKARISFKILRELNYDCIWIQFYFRVGSGPFFSPTGFTPLYNNNYLSSYKSLKFKDNQLKFH